MQFFVGLHMVAQAHRFHRCMISANVLRRRKSDFAVNDWMLDSGAFTQVVKHGGYIVTPEEYAEQANRWASCGNLLAAVSQDFMCEPIALQATGMSVEEHQFLTIARYMSLRRLCKPYLLPVLQGWKPEDYAAHVRAYGSMLKHNSWVGVGSVCKRNSQVKQIEAVLKAILQVRPDLRLHGFGLKFTALTSPFVRSALYSSDSMAWSFNARSQGRGYDANRWEEAQKYVDKVEALLAA